MIIHLIMHILSAFFLSLIANSIFFLLNILCLKEFYMLQTMGKNNVCNLIT